MSNNYRWKDKYYNYLDQLDTTGNYLYFSPLGTGNGSKESPASIRILGVNTKNRTLIFSASNVIKSITSGTFTTLYGQGMNSTILENVVHPAEVYSFIHDCNIKSMNITPYKGYILLSRCKIDCPIPSNQHTRAYNSVITKSPTATLTYNNNSFVGIEVLLSRIQCANSLICNSDVIMKAADITQNQNMYLAFSNCKYMIENETDFKPLEGSTEEELRADFVARCTNQGITLTKGGEYNDKDIYAYRWVFSNEPNNHGNVVKDSIIDKFQKRRYVYLGWNPAPINEITITNDKTKSQSLTYLDNSGNLKIENNTIKLSEDLDIADITNGQQSGTVRSNIIWLGEGKQKVDGINIHHNLATQYGVMIDSDPSIVPATNGAIEAGQMYLVRTKSSGKETITYNGVSYSTALSEGNNIFVGVTEAKSWDGGSGNIVVYKINDHAISNTIRMRIVDEIPKDTITTLVKDVWYFVEPNDIANPSGTVKYKGAEYPCFGSFKAEDETSFQLIGECHLRRCWKDDFNLDTDKSFWQSRQKPIWFDVVPGDMRCLLEKNNSLSDLMEYDLTRKTYITSGHPDFYALISGDNGAARPPYEITGKYMQIELIVSTLNPM